MTQINPSSTMAEILQTIPGAQRTLMQRYHVGGCTSCGYAMEEPLADVLGRHEIDDHHAVLESLVAAGEAEKNVQISCAALKGMMDSGEAFKLLDVRMPEEHDIVKLPASILADADVGQEILTSWPKDTAIVTYCHHGLRSLDAAMFLIQHGMTNVRSLTGGIEAWADEIDPSLPRY